MTEEEELEQYAHSSRFSNAEQRADDAAEIQDEQDTSPPDVNTSDIMTS